MKPLAKPLGRLFRWNETRVHELNYLFWECTTRCNLHCRHCGSDCTASGGEPDMPLDDFLRAFDTIPREAIPHGFTVVLTGGEPLLRRDIEEIGCEIKRRGAGWGLVSNGWLYDGEMHRRLMGAGMGSLTISLDGVADEHDLMRGRHGSYNRTVEAIAIAARDARVNFDVVTCVNQRNLSQLPQMHDLLVSLGVPQWRLFTIIPIGRAKDQPDLHLSDSRFIQLMDFIAAHREAKRQVMNVTFSCEHYLGRYECRVRENPFFCHAGINIASVLVDGTISACPNIDRRAFGQGNIYRDNLWEVWQTRFQPFRDHGWARRGQCKDCEVFRDCRGGGMHSWHGDCAANIDCRYHIVHP